MRIGLFGHTDKRPVLYPMLKLLQKTGDILFVTDNTQFRRLTEDDSNIGYFQNILVCVSDDTSDEVFRLIEKSPDDFTHIIYDVKSYLPETDKNLLITSYREDEGSDEDIKVFLPDIIPVKINYDKAVKKGKVCTINLGMPYWTYLEKVESFKILPSFTSKSMCKLLSQLIDYPDKKVEKILKEGHSK